MGYKIRTARRGDLGKWTGLRRLLWPRTPRTAHLREERIWLSTPGCVCFLAFAPDGRLVGFLEGRARAHVEEDWRVRVAYLDGWCVDPGFRRKGVAKAMLHSFARWAKWRKCRKMLSDTWTWNVRAKKVHEALGFKVVDRRIHFERSLGR